MANARWFKHTVFLAGCLNDSSPDNPPPAAEAPPNILFIVIDDVGVDQFSAFGYGGAVPANTMSINAIAEAGVRFRNTWTMPTCSPTRVSYFDQHYFPVHADCCERLTKYQRSNR